MSNVIPYARGLLCCSVCAPAEMDGAAVAAEFERESSADTEAGWQVSTDAAFRDGQPNPCDCDIDPSRRHWLLDC